MWYVKNGSTDIWFVFFLCYFEWIKCVRLNMNRMKLICLLCCFILLENSAFHLYVVIVVCLCEEIWTFSLLISVIAGAVCFQQRVQLRVLVRYYVRGKSQRKQSDNCSAVYCLLGELERSADSNYVQSSVTSIVTCSCFSSNNDGSC